MTPNTAIVQVDSADESFSLGLPLFLLWIPAILLAAFILLAAVIACVIFGVPWGSDAMKENRKQILEMLAAGRITTDEAERLLAALEPEPRIGAGAQAAAGANSAKLTGPKTHPKYLRVLIVEADESTTEDKGVTTVNVRVPMQLLRAGVRLAALIPQRAHERLDRALASHGIPLTLSQIKPENLEDLIDHLEDLTIDVDGKDQNSTKVRVFCE